MAGAIPLDEDFLAALAHICRPPAAWPLGFDRLVMLVTGAPNIDFRALDAHFS